MGKKIPHSKEQNNKDHRGQQGRKIPVCDFASAQEKRNQQQQKQQGSGTSAAVLSCPQNHLRLADAHRLIHGRKNHKDIFCHALRKIHVEIQRLYTEGENDHTQHNPHQFGINAVSDLQGSLVLVLFHIKASVSFLFLPE